jgi:hypothetical protein
MFRFAFIFMALLASCLAKEVKVLRVHCDPEFESLHEFLLSLDEADNVHALIRRSNRTQTTFTNNELMNKEVVISSLKDKKVILLCCPNYNPSAGGPFVIKYLHNGITNAYKAMPFWLEKDKEGKWQLFTPPPNKHKIDSLKVIARKIAGITIGIQYLQIIH